MGHIIHQYFSTVQNLLNETLATQGKSIEAVAERVATTINNNGIIHIFGSGHSHMLAEEVFFRAGGLAPINPIFFEELMLHKGAVRSSELERKNDLAVKFLGSTDIRPEDTVIVISTSGRNPIPIDVAIFAKEAGAFVAGITSLSYSKSQPSRHKTGQHLYEVVEIVIDNLSVAGDAVLEHPRLENAFAPTSTVIGATIINSIFAEAVRILADMGETPPIFLSGNIDGADEHNRTLIEKYKQRIPLLK